MTARRLRIAVDVGGTFTDVTLWDPRGPRLVAAKALTTPKDRAIGVLDGIALALEAAGSRPDEVLEVVHGSTTGTNALIERTGAKVGLLTTEGFRDVLEIGRIMRPDAGLYDFSVDLPLPLVPRHLRLEARERVDANGTCWCRWTKPVSSPLRSALRIGRGRRGRLLSVFLRLAGA